MAFKNQADARMRALSIFITSEKEPTRNELHALLGVSRPTLTKWRKEDKWDERRKEASVTNFELAIEIKKELQECVKDIRKARDESETGFVNKEYFQRLDKLSSILVRIDGKYDLKGNVLQTIQLLIEYARVTKDKEAIAVLNRIVPSFLNWIESKLQ